MSEYRIIEDGAARCACGAYVCEWCDHDGRTIITGWRARRWIKRERRAIAQAHAEVAARVAVDSIGGAR